MGCCDDVEFSVNVISRHLKLLSGGIYDCRRLAEMFLFTSTVPLSHASGRPLFMVITSLNLIGMHVEI